VANQHNSISFMGNIVEDAKVIGDNTIAFKVAQNQYDRKAKDEQHTNWFQCYMYDKNPNDRVGWYYKGGKVMVSGRLKATLKDDKYMNLDINVTDVVPPPKRQDAVGQVAAASEPVDDDIPF
jgi:hypothetical protein